MHRDIKPGNLLLDGRDRLAIADFGIARLAMEDQLTATGQVLGTASYISPEQAVGEPATAASDRYALAVVAFELLTGQKPFQAEHFAAQARAHVEDQPPLATERDPSLPRGVDAVLDRGHGEGARRPLGDRDRDGRRAGPRDGRRAARDRADAPARAVAPPRRAGRTAPAGGARRRSARRRRASCSPAGRLILIAVLAFVLLSGGDGGEPQARAADRDDDRDRRAHAASASRRRATPSRRRRHAEPTPTPTPTPPTPAASAGPTWPRAPAAAPGLQARQAGDYDGARRSPSRRWRRAATPTSSTRAATRCSRSARR